MDKVNHLLRRSRLRSFAASAGHAFGLDAAVAKSGGAAENESTFDWAGEKRDIIELDRRFYASLNQYSPDQLASMSEAAAATASAVVADAGGRVCYPRLEKIRSLIVAAGCCDDGSIPQ